MREKLNHSYVDSYERTILLPCGTEESNHSQGRHTGCVEELIAKVINVPIIRFKICINQ